MGPDWNDLRMEELKQKMEIEKIKAKRDLVERIAISSLWVLMALASVAVVLMKLYKDCP